LHCVINNFIYKDLSNQLKERVYSTTKLMTV
jgi:hypothetical protein